MPPNQEDGADGGDPVVTDGLSLCRIHHAAYDRVGITPDYESGSTSVCSTRSMGRCFDMACKTCIAAN